MHFFQKKIGYLTFCAQLCTYSDTWILLIAIYMKILKIYCVYAVPVLLTSIGPNLDESCKTELPAYLGDRMQCKNTFLCISPEFPGGEFQAMFYRMAGEK